MNTQAQPQYKPRPPTARDLQKQQVALTIDELHQQYDDLNEHCWQLEMAIKTFAFLNDPALRERQMVALNGLKAKLTAVEAERDKALQFLINATKKAQQEDPTVAYDRAMKVVA